MNDGLCSALEALLADAETIYGNETCDHEVGICWCGARRTLEAARAALQKARREVA